MTRINTNVSSLIAQRNLRTNSFDLNTSLERLSTGLRINRGKDDPAGLIASENLRSEIGGLKAALGNADRADQVANIAEGGLQEVANLLTELQGLITQTANTAGLSREEREANQLQVDSILQTIDRLASATSFQGLKLLNGNLDYVTDNVNAQVGGFTVRGAKLDFGGTRDVNVLVIASAQVAGFLMSMGGAALDLASSGSEFVVEIGGVRGSRELSFSSGTSVSSIADAINSFSSVTGVKATVSGTGVRLSSTNYGSDEFVSVRVTDDGGIGSASGIGVYNLVADNALAAGGAVTTFANSGTRVTDFGQDVRATVNGVTATSRGTEVQINTDFLDVAIDLNYDSSGGATANAAKLGAMTAFTITGGGADFMLASKVDIGGKVSLGVQNVAVRDLGRSVTDIGGSPTPMFLKDLGIGRTLNLVDGDLSVAQHVIERSIREVNSLRGRLGSFQQNTIGATIRSLGIGLENSTAAESVIRDTEFASETSRLTQAQVLSQSATSALALANAAPQTVLQLLG